MVADIDKKKIRNVVRRTHTERRKTSLLKDVKIGKWFEEKVIKLADVGVTNWWGHFKDGVQNTYNDVCVDTRSDKKRRRYMVVEWRGELGSFKEERSTQGNVSE